MKTSKIRETRIYKEFLEKYIHECREIAGKGYFKYGDDKICRYHMQSDKFTNVKLKSLIKNICNTVSPYQDLYAEDNMELVEILHQSLENIPNPNIYWNNVKSLSEIEINVNGEIKKIRELNNQNTNYRDIQDNKTSRAVEEMIVNSIFVSDNNQLYVFKVDGFNIVGFKKLEHDISDLIKAYGLNYVDSDNLNEVKKYLTPVPQTIIKKIDKYNEFKVIENKNIEIMRILYSAGLRYE